MGQPRKSRHIHQMSDCGGLAAVRHAIEPGRGLLALPGGFIEYGEDWRDAVVRELYEETGLVGAADEVRLFDVQSAPIMVVLADFLAEQNRG